MSVSFALLLLAACGHGANGAPAAAVAHPTSDAAPSPQALSPLRAGRLTQVGPSGLALPILLRPVSAEGRRFAVAAARALRLVYEEDVDDASQLEALVHRLETSVHRAGPEGAEVAQAFGPALAAGRARAQRLQACAPGIRALKEAYRAVYIEDGSRALRRLDPQACATAWQLLQPLVHAEPGFVLTVEPMGPTSLEALLAPCHS